MTKFRPLLFFVDILTKCLMKHMILPPTKSFDLSFILMKRKNTNQS